jgi:hypothetical protein
MSIIIPANSAVAGGYDVANSCRFDGSSSYLQKTYANSQNKTFSISTWVKRSELGDAGAIWSSYHNATNYLTLAFKDDDALRFQNVSAGVNMNFTTNRLFRDVSAWMHILAIVDTTDGTAGDRQQIFINGVRETSFSTSTAYALNAAAEIGATDKENIVGRHGTGDDYFDGYMAEHVFIDGLALEPDSFGEFDEDSGIFKPIDVSGLTFGTNGYYLDFEDSGNLGNDANGGTDLSENGLAAIDQTTDTCTNNFATGNILSPYANRTITDGSLTITSTTTQWTNLCSTIGVSSGKWWIELKHTAGSYGGLGIVFPFPKTENNVIGDFSAPVVQQIGYIAASGDKKINNSTSSYGSTWVGTGDIVNMSLNLDDNELKFYKNGTVQDSGTAIAISSGYTYFVGTSNYNSSGSSFNFGNPAYAISSGNADGNGYGNFEYAPPSGFLALCTKNLAEHG